MTLDTLINVPKMPPLDMETVWPSYGNELGGSARLAPDGQSVAAVAFERVPLPGTSYFVPRRFEVTFGDPRLPYEVRLLVQMTDVTGPVCQELSVSQQGAEDLEVSQKGLRRLPIAELMQQGARFMAMEVTEDDEGGTHFRPARLSPDGLTAVTAAWRWSRATSRRASFPPTQPNLKIVGDLVKRELATAKKIGRSPQVYASVQRELAPHLQPGETISRATVQRRIKEAQNAGLAPIWVKEKKP